MATAAAQRVAFLRELEYRKHLVAELWNDRPKPCGLFRDERRPDKSTKRETPLLCRHGNSGATWQGRRRLRGATRAGRGLGFAAIWPRACLCGRRIRYYEL